MGLKNYLYFSPPPSSGVSGGVSPLSTGKLAPTYLSNGYKD
jgi:hypothetical protein